MEGKEDINAVPAQILQWNTICPGAVKELAHERIKSQIHGRPNSLAVNAWDAQLTYHDLDVASSNVAQRLLVIGVLPDSLVPFCFEKSAWSIVAMLGILKAGCAFVPLDPTHPLDRLDGIVRTLQTTTLLTSVTNLEKVVSLAANIVVVSGDAMDSQVEQPLVPHPQISPSNLAYVVFTSGSTGTPKGVMIEHQALTTSCLALGHKMGSTPETKMLCFSSFSFDASILEIFPTLFYGGCVCMPSDADRVDNLAGYINQHLIDMVFLTPSVAGVLDPHHVPSVRTLTTGGEAFSRENLRLWLEDPDRRIFNAYGPSEITIACNMTELEPVSAAPCCETLGSPIGHAISTVSWIVDADDHHQLMPVGGVGELLVQGHTLARGYWRDEAKTSAVFIAAPRWYRETTSSSTLSAPSPPPPPRFYKTGDLVQYNPDGSGSLLYIGRKDLQIKLRGQRVELGEIEHRIAENAIVSHAVVVFPSMGCLQGQLVGVLALIHNFKPNFDGTIRLWDNDQSQEAIPKIQESLAKSLPSYMVPARLIVVESLPLLPSGKVHRKLLQKWVESIASDQALADVSSALNESSSLPSSSPTMNSLRQIIGDVLNIPIKVINPGKSFLALGGDSISAMQVVFFGKAQGMNIRTKDILISSSLFDLESHITALNTTCARVLQDETNEKFELSAVQRMYFSLVPNGDNEFNQGFTLQVADHVQEAHLEKAIHAVVERHSMLRARFTGQQGTWTQRTEEDTKSSYVFRTPKERGTGAALINIEMGPLLVADLISKVSQGRLLELTAHHLVIDLVSWRIIIHDLETFLSEGKLSPEKPLGFQNWLQLLEESSSKDVFPAVLQSWKPTFPELEYWGCPQTLENVTQFITLESDTTEQLLRGCHSPLGTNPVDIMLSALLYSFGSVFTDRSPPTIFDEGHGRNPGDENIDVSQTVGWFTVLFPILVDIKENDSIVNIIRRVKDFRRALAGHEVSFFNTQVLNRQNGQVEKCFPVEVLFNFFGQYQQLEKDGALLQRVAHGITENMGRDPLRVALFDVSAQIECSQLRFTFTYNKHMLHQEEIHQWVREFPHSLNLALAELQQLDFQYTISDFPLLSLDDQRLEVLVDQLLENPGLSVPGDIADIFPCTPMQEAILASQTRNPSLYQSSLQWKIVADSGKKIDLEALVGAWQQVVRRHSVLRTLFISSVDATNLFYQVVLKHNEAPTRLVSCTEDMVFLPACSLPDFDPNQTKHEHEFTIYSTASDRAFCQLNINHALFDGTSVQVVLKDLALAYQSMLPQNIGPSYKDYVVFWEETSHAEDQSYWENFLADSPSCIFPCQEIEQNSYHEHVVRIDSSLVQRIRDFCLENEVTAANLFQLSWALVLRTMTDSDSVCFGCLTSGRDLPIEGIQDAVGAYMKMLVCRFDITETDSLIQALNKSARDFRQSLEHQNASLADIHRALGLQGHHLFNTAMSFQRLLPSGISMGEGIRVEELADKDPSEYDMTINVRDSPATLEIALRYWKSRISDQQAQNVEDMLRRLLQLIISFPEMKMRDLDLSGGQNDQFYEWNRNLPCPTERCLHEIFQSVTEMQPHKEAVYSSDGRLSYAELDALSSALASNLITLGVGPEVLVPVCFEKSIWAIVAMLGVLKAGGGFVPIDPSHPPQRHLAIIEEVGARLVLVSTATTEILESYYPNVLEVSKRTINANNLVAQSASRNELLTPSNVAYIIFTSGSTGKPKGVVIEHRAISSSCTEHAKPMGFESSSRVLQFSSYTFDAACAEIFTTLITGGTVCVPSEKQRMGNIVTFINQANVNWVFSTPSFIRTVDPATVPSLRTLAVGGEIVGQDIIATWMPHVTFIHVYGPTECTIFSVSHTVEKDEAHRVILGRSFGSVSWIVDPNNPDKLCALGSTGELLIQGPILARGYLNDPEKTKAAFIDSPIWLPGERKKMYRTGDLVRYNQDGTMVYIGRKDNQVKLRGQRLELGEIEYNMSLNLPERTAVAVELVHRAGMEDFKALAAFVCDNPASSEMINKDDLFDPMTPTFCVEMTTLRQNLYKVLPPYMVPSIYIHIKKMPPTPTGKLDRPLLRGLVQNLSQKDHALYSLMTGEKKIQPSTGPEKLMQAFWSDILKVDVSNIWADSNFFHLGGDSIAAFRLVRLAHSQKLSIAVADILRNPSLTLMSLAMKDLENTVSRFLEPFALIKYTNALDHLVDQSAKICNVERNRIEDIYPCTSLQEGLLALSNKQAGAYVSQFIFPLTVYVNSDRFKSAWELAVETTPVLRTRIVAVDDWPILQVVVRETLDWKNESNLPRYLAEAQKQKFETGTSLSTYAMIYDGEERYFVLTCHHSIYDGWSLPLLFKKVESIYNQSQAVYPSLSGFNHFIQHITNIDQTQSQNFWGGLLAGAEHLNFPQFPTPVYAPIPDKTLSHIIQLERIPRSMFTISTILQCAWAIILGQHAETQDVTFGHVISGRNAAVPGISDLIGPTISTVPVRVLLDPDQSIRDLLDSLQNQSTQRIPFEQAGLQNIARLGSGAHAACQFQNLFVIQPLAVQDVTLLGSRRMQSDDGHARSVPLTVECNLGEGQLEVVAHFDSNLLDECKMRLIIRQFEHILLELSYNQERSLRQVSRCSDYEKQLISNWNKDIPLALKTCVHHLIKKQAIAWPNAPAVHAWDYQLNYSELDRYATAFAHQLVALGVGPEVWVPVVMDKSAWTIVAMLGILKAGGACATLDPSHPLNRLSGIIQDMEARILVVGPQHRTKYAHLVEHIVTVDKLFLESLPPHSEDPRTTVSYTSAAVAIFTSGSTGKPKGIVIEHAHLCTSSEAHGSAMNVGPDSRVFGFASFAFDVSLGDTWTTIMRGGCICIPSEHDRVNNLSHAITETRANWIGLTPTVARLLSPESVPTIKTLTLGGEAIGKDDIETWADHVRVIGFYGPAETVIGAMMSDLSANRTLNPRTLGHGLDANFWVVDPNDHDLLAPVGTVGELLLQGPAISRGYLNQPEKSSNSYLTNPPKFLTEAHFGQGRSDRIFKTGDLVSQNPTDGALIFLGRKDTQVKLHGQRIELQEIEEQLALNSVEQYAWSVELIQSSGSRQAFLAAFFVENESTSTAQMKVQALPITSQIRDTISNLKNRLVSLLPKYMVPSMFIPLTTMPKNTSFKTDRGQLRLIGEKIVNSQDSASYLQRENPSNRESEQRPITAKELKMQKLWSTALSLPADSISSTDNFFDLGGDSITAMRLVSSARTEGLSLSVFGIFQNPSLAKMSDATGSRFQPSYNSASSQSSSDSISSLSSTESLLPSNTLLQKQEFGLDKKHVVATDYQAWAVIHGTMGQKGFYNDLFFELEGSIDVSQFMVACRFIFSRHVILNCSFVAYKDRILVNYSNDNVPEMDFQQYSWSNDTETGAPLAWEQATLQLGKPTVRFALIQKSDDAHRLVLRISHAQYDGISIPFLLNDLKSAYLDEAVSPGPDFLAFLHEKANINYEVHQKFWRDLLRNSSMTEVVSRKILDNKGEVNERVQQAMRSPSLRGTGTTAAIVFKAAWALVLSTLSHKTDVVFGHITTGRNGALPGIESVVGACLNITPVRAHCNPEQSIIQLLDSLHAQHAASLLHESMGWRAIIKSCTPWPSWTYFSSIIQHQNLQEDATGIPIKFGQTATCTFTGGVGRLGASVDVWITTTPRGEDTDAQLHFSPHIPRHVAQQMLGMFCAVATKMGDGTFRNNIPLRAVVENTMDVRLPLLPRRLISVPKIINPSSVSTLEGSKDFIHLRKVVEVVWKEALGSNQIVISLDDSFANLGGDFVTAGIIANAYQTRGYDLSIEDVIDNLTVEDQIVCLARAGSPA